MANISMMEKYNSSGYQNPCASYYDNITYFYNETNLILYHLMYYFQSEEPSPTASAGSRQGGGAVNQSYIDGQEGSPVSL